MSNLIGALHVGPTMIGADADRSNRNLRATVQGGTQISARFNVSMRPRVTVAGGTVITADMQSRTLTRPRLSGRVVGGTVIVYKAPTRKQIILVGEVGAAVAGSMLRHGHVLVLDAPRPRAVIDNSQRVQPRVPYYT